MTLLIDCDVTQTLPEETDVKTQHGQVGICRIQFGNLTAFARLNKQLWLLEQSVQKPVSGNPVLARGALNDRIQVRDHPLVLFYDEQLIVAYLFILDHLGRCAFRRISQGSGGHRRRANQET